MDLLDYENTPFEELLSFAEAAEIWKLEQSTLRKAVEAGRLKPGRDCRKFGKQWVVTVDAMARAFSHVNYPKYGPWNNYITRLKQARATTETPE